MVSISNPACRPSTAVYSSPAKRRSANRRAIASASLTSPRERSVSSRQRRRRARALSSKPIRLVPDPETEHEVGEPWEERDAGDEEPIRDRHVHVAGTLLGGVGYLLCDPARRHTLWTPAALFTFRAPRVLPK